MLTIMNDNRLLQADLSMITGTENAQFPLSNTKHPFTTKTFRSNESTIEVLIDLKTTTPVDSFAIVGSSVDGMGLTDIKLYGSSTTSFTGATQINVDISAIHNFGYVLLPSTSSFRYWKLEATSGGSYVEISNFFIGERKELTNNGLDLGSFEFGTRDNVDISTNDYGQRFINKYNKIKEVRGTIRYLNKAELDLMDDIWSQNGLSTPIWVMVDTDNCIATDGEYKLSGYFYIDRDFSYRASGPGLFDLNLDLGEAT